MQKLTLIAAAMVMATSVGVASAPAAVYAQTNTNQSQTTTAPVEFEVRGIMRGPQGSLQEMKTVDVPNGKYDVKLTFTNQHSVHPDTNIVVASGDSSVKVENVEKVRNGETKNAGTLNVTNGKVTVSTQMGPDKISSGRITVVMTPVEEPKKPEAPKEEPKAPAKVESAKDVKEDVKEVPATIPETGVAGLASGAIALGSLAYSANLYLQSRRNLK